MDDLGPTDGVCKIRRGLVDWKMNGACWLKKRPYGTEVRVWGRSKPLGEERRGMLCY